MMKRILILIIIVLLFGTLSFAQDDGEVYLLEQPIKVYEKDTIFSKSFIVESGNYIEVDTNYKDDTFKKVILEDDREGYVLADDLSGDTVSAATSDDMSQGDNTTASARANTGGEGVISFGSLNFDEYGNIKQVNKMEFESGNISDEEWEEFRKTGGLGEYASAPKLFP